MIYKNPAIFMYFKKIFNVFKKLSILRVVKRMKGPEECIFNKIRVSYKFWVIRGKII